MQLSWTSSLRSAAAFLFLLFTLPSFALAQTARTQAPPTPTDVAPGSITYEDVAYPHPVQYLPFTTYGQDVRIAYMDVAPAAAPNGHTVVLFHGMNFAGFYFGSIIDALTREGFRVVAVDQIGFGRSSKPIIPYNFHDMALNTRRILEHLKIGTVMVVGHSMGGMLAARFATQNADMTERVVLYNPIGLTDSRFGRRWTSTDESYERTLDSTYQGFYASIRRYFAHDPTAWKPEYEKFARIHYARTLGGDWPRYAAVQARIRQITYLDPVVYDWAHIQAPTLAFGGREDGPGFAARMQHIADTIPNGNGRLHLLPGLGHVPHLEAPERFFPPLIAFLEQGV
jgi:pimeloyl-ACP methyl ester carboxylesterase